MLPPSVGGSVLLLALALGRRVVGPFLGRLWRLDVHVAVAVLLNVGFVSVFHALLPTRSTNDKRPPKRALSPNPP